MTRAAMRSVALLLAALVLTALVLTACDQAPQGTASDGAPPATLDAQAAAVATYEGGRVTLADVQRRVAQDLRAGRVRADCAAPRMNLDALVGCYRQVAEDLAMERLVLSEVADLDAATGEPGEEYDRLPRRTLLAAYLRRLPEGVEVADDRIDARYQADPARYRRPGAATLWNIFRRHEDPARPQATLALLESLRQRFRDGETFASLARGHSHSETRLRDGRVGRVSEGQLPKALEDVVFALDSGDVSAPVKVSGGAVLLHVTEVLAPAQLSLGEVRERFRHELLAEDTDRRVAEQVAALRPPQGALVLDGEALDEALAAKAQDRPILEIGLYRLTAAELRRLAGAGPAGPTGPAQAAQRSALLRDAYQRERRMALLLRHVLESDQPAARAARQAAVAQVVDRRVRAQMWRLVDAQPERLRAFHADNRSHYQSPLRFKLHSLDLPFGADPPGQMRRLERLAQELAAGRTSLNAAAGRSGGAVTDHGWLDFEALDGVFPNKAESYILQTEAGGFTLPYQQDEALHLLWVEQREEPRPLPYADVRDQGRLDYFDRFEDQLYGEARGRWLGDAGLAFAEQAGRGLLAPPGATQAGTLPDP